MAQVIWQDLAGDQVRVESAGSDPTGYVHPLAIEVLQELELPTDGLASKSLAPFLDQPIDLAVTVCDHAQQSCPSLPKVKNRLHWPFDDPADAQGTDQEKLELFRRVRDEIRCRVTEYLASPEEKTSSSP